MSRNGEPVLARLIRFENDVATHPMHAFVLPVFRKLVAAQVAG